MRALGRSPDSRGSIRPFAAAAALAAGLLAVPRGAGAYPSAMDLFHPGGSYTEIGAPFLAYQMPSLLPYQQGTPLGLQYELGYAHVESKLNAAFAQGLGDKGFGAGYQFFTGNPKHSLALGFGKCLGRGSLGGAAHLLMHKKVSLTFDAAGSFEVRKSLFLSVKAANLLLPDTGIADLHRELSVVAGGEVWERGRLTADIGAMAVHTPGHAQPYGYGVLAQVSKGLLRNPCLEFTLAVSYDTVPGLGRSAAADLGIGWVASVGDVRIAMVGGYRYDYYGVRDALHCSAYFNPQQARDRSPPAIHLAVADTAFDPKSQTDRTSVLLSLRAREEDNGSGLAQWALIVRDRPDQSGRIVRSYAGGGVPPSSILWDGKNGDGAYVKPGVYYIRFVCFDKKKNKAESGPLSVRVRESAQRPAD